MSLILGLALSVAAFALLALRGGGLQALFDPVALALIAGGLLGALLIICPLRTLKETLAVAMQTLRPVKKPHALVDQVVSLAQLARRGGVLALEGSEQEIRDPTLKKGIELLLGSADPAAVRSILESDSALMGEKEHAAQEIMERMAVFSPGLGIVGTLVEIAGMLSGSAGTASLAPQVAHALLPVVYGAVLSYLLLFPLAARMRANAARRRSLRGMAAEGVLAIQAGEPPALVQQRLEAFLH